MLEGDQHSPVLTTSLLQPVLHLDELHAFTCRQGDKDWVGGCMKGGRAALHYCTQCCTWMSSPLSRAGQPAGRQETKRQREFPWCAGSPFASSFSLRASTSGRSKSTAREKGSNKGPPGYLQQSRGGGHRGTAEGVRIGPEAPLGGAKSLPPWRGRASKRGPPRYLHIRDRRAEEGRGCKGGGIGICPGAHRIQRREGYAAGGRAPRRHSSNACWIHTITALVHAGSEVIAEWEVILPLSFTVCRSLTRWQSLPAPAQ